jgi:hypothetical protein
LDVTVSPGETGSSLGLWGTLIHALRISIVIRKVRIIFIVRLHILDAYLIMNVPACAINL